jgi:hypothetical protein
MDVTTVREDGQSIVSSRLHVVSQDEHGSRLIPNCPVQCCQRDVSRQETV